MDKLDKLLSENKILRAYQEGSSAPINNFLQGKVSSISKNSVYTPTSRKDKKVYEGFLLHQVRDLGEVLFSKVGYNPVTVNFVSELIKLDKIFRESKQFNSEPITVFRGGGEKVTYPVQNFLISTSISERVATSFCKEDNPVVLKINLPENFPYIRLSDSENVQYGFEQEILLPPCELKVVGNWNGSQNAQNGKENVEFLEAVLEPKSLAKVFLDRMNNLPKDFPKMFHRGRNWFAQQFAESKQILEEYVKSFENDELVKPHTEKVSKEELKEAGFEEPSPYVPSKEQLELEQKDKQNQSQISGKQKSSD